MKIISEDGSRQPFLFDQVLSQTLKTMEKGREQMFTVAENARAECARLRRAMEEIDNQLVDIEQELLGLAKEDKVSRLHVAEIMNNFERYGEYEIKSAFELARELQVKMTVLQERRNQLQNKGKDLESSYLSLWETAERAEEMISQVGVASDILGGNLHNINIKMESLNQRQQMGLQVIRAQEEERRRVAREIHDGPAQSMANVVLRMEYCERLLEIDQDKVRAELRDLKEIVRNNLQDMRKIIFDLRPMALDDLGVVPALKRYIEDFRQKHDITTEVMLVGREKRLEPTLEIALFRLVQEALNNVIKHACASKVKVFLEFEKDMVKGSVEDNGIGFDMEAFGQQNPGSHFGLISMRERVELLGGGMDINSGPGQGTSVTFMVPLTR